MFKEFHRFIRLFPCTATLKDNVTLSIKKGEQFIDLIEIYQLRENPQDNVVNIFLPMRVHHFKMCTSYLERVSGLLN